MLLLCCFMLLQFYTVFLEFISLWDGKADSEYISSDMQSSLFWKYLKGLFSNCNNLCSKSSPGWRQLSLQKSYYQLGVLTNPADAFVMPTFTPGYLLLEVMWTASLLALWPQMFSWCLQCLCWSILSSPWWTDASQKAQCHRRKRGLIVLCNLMWRMGSVTTAACKFRSRAHPLVNSVSVGSLHKWQLYRICSAMYLKAFIVA